MEIKKETSLGKGVRDEKVKEEVRDILQNDISIDLDTSGGGDRSLSKPIQNAFRDRSYPTEVPPKTLSNKRVDVYVDGVPIEIDIGSKRTAVLTNLLTLQVEYEQGHINGAILIVPENKSDWGGKSWFKTRGWAKREINKYRTVIDLPIWLIGVSP